MQKAQSQPLVAQCLEFTGNSATQSVPQDAGMQGAEGPADSLVGWQLSSAEMQKSTQNVTCLKKVVSGT